MAFLIDPKRRHTFRYDENDVSFSVTFEFICAEDMDIKEVKRRLGSMETTDPNERDYDKSVAFMLYNLRKSLVECEDIQHHETKEPLIIRDKDGSINEENQKAVFEAIRSLTRLVGEPDEKGKQESESFITQIITAYMGPTGKNLNPGATQQ